MQKVRILGIAPYEGMCNLMKQIAKGRNDIELTAYVGDLEQGAEIASAYTSGDIDVILSRGGTAERIRELTSVPVVDIPLSVYDILRSIKLAENYNSPYAIIGFPAITKNAHFLCDVLRYTTEIYTIHTQEESKKRLEQLSQKGYNMVLCDMITKSLAQQFGISSILITSGSESVEAAIDQAVQVSQTYYQMTSQIRFFQTIIEEQDRDVFIYTDAGEQVYTSAHHTPHDAVLKKMQTNISLIAEEGQKRIYLEASGTMTILTGSKKIINDQIYILYSVSTRKSPLSLSKNGIQYINKEEAADRFFNSFYSTISPTFLAGRTIEQYAQGAQPLMILGEAGTYKEQMANLLYTNGNRSNSPLVAIDCARLHDKGRTFLVENDNSPFADSDITIHMKNMKSISDKQFEELLRFMKDAGVQERNRLLFTFPYSEIRGVEERCQSLINTFSCSAIFMPTLRNHKSDIPNLASLYISMLNMQMAKEIVGFEPKALESLQTYDWPYNFDQFTRVLQELVSVTDTSYIRHSDTEKLLKQENKLFYSSADPVNGGIDLNRTLEEITLDIVHRVLMEEHGNQSATAKRLGISRTTLWRMLQNSGSM